MILNFIGLILISFFVNSNAQIIYRAATNNDIASSLDLDYRVSMEFFKPFFKDNYAHLSLGKDPDHALSLDLENDKKLFPDCVNMVDKDRLFVAYDDEKKFVVGLIVFHKEAAYLLEIDLLLIDKEYRTKGIGKNLVQKALSYFKDIKACGVHVFNKNYQAINFYQKLGFINKGSGPENKNTVYGISYKEICVYCYLDNHNK